MSDNNLKVVWPDWEFQGDLGTGAHGKVHLAKQIAPNGGAVYRAIKIIEVPPQKEAIQSAIDLGISATLLKNYFDVFKDDLNWEMTLYRSADSENLGKFDEFSFVENDFEPGWTCYIRESLYTPLNTYYNGADIADEDAIQIGKDICSGLTACEKFNLVHGGICPNNIMVNDAGKFLLVDYGITRCLSKAGAKLFKTDKSFDAPEVVADGKYSKQSDIYSLGMALAFFVNGGMLNGTENLKCRKELAAVIKKATAQDAADRYKSASEMLADLERIPVPVSAPRGTSAVSLALAAVGMSPSLGNKEKDIIKAKDKAKAKDKTKNNATNEAPKAKDNDKKVSNEQIKIQVSEVPEAAEKKTADTTNAAKAIKAEKKQKVEKDNDEKAALIGAAVTGAAVVSAVTSLPPSVAAAKAKADAKAAKKQNKTAEARAKQEAKDSATVAAAAVKTEKQRKKAAPKQKIEDIPSVSVGKEKKSRAGLWVVLILLLVIIAAALWIFKPWEMLNSGNSNDDPVIEDTDTEDTEPNTDIDIEPEDTTPDDTQNDTSVMNPIDDNADNQENTDEDNSEAEDETQNDDESDNDNTDNNTGSTGGSSNGGSSSSGNSSSGSNSGSSGSGNSSGGSSSGSSGSGSSGGGSSSGSSGSGSSGGGSSSGGSSSGNSSGSSNNNKPNAKDYKWATTRITKDDLKGMTRYETQMLINEIYARNGLIFGSSRVQSKFENEPWYNGTTSYLSKAYSKMNTTEKKNINTIVTYQVDNGFRGGEKSKFLAESHTTYLTMEDLEGMTKDETTLLINEIYARHGRIFKSERLQTYFENQDWYIPVTDSSDAIVAQFNEYELANMKLLVKYQKEMGYR